MLLTLGYALFCKLLELDGVRHRISEATDPKIVTLCIFHHPSVLKSHQFALDLIPLLDFVKPGLILVQNLVDSQMVLFFVIIVLLNDHLM